MYIQSKTAELCNKAGIDVYKISDIGRAPIQSELQKYLRETYNAHIVINPIQINYDLYNNSDTEEEPIYVYLYCAYCTLFTETTEVDEQYAEYEECLEVALQYILKAIIKHNENNEMETKI